MPTRTDMGFYGDLPDMAEKLESYLSKQKAGIGRLLQDLVRIPTVNPPGRSYLDFVDAVQRRLVSLGLGTEVVSVPIAYASRFIPNAKEYPRASVIGNLDVGAPKTIHFNCHYDVVPAAGRWRYGPFKPKLSRGWLFGRGSSDMKGAIACVCYAIKALKDLKVMPKMNIEVSFTPDEETGGDLGVGYLVRKGHIKADYAIIGEGGGGLNVGVGHNGVLWLETTIHGKAAHAASPQNGINAFENMAGLAMGLQSLKPKLSKRIFKSPAGKKMHPTINAGGVFAVGDGAKVNTVPAEARFTVDRRITPAEKLRDAEQELRAALRDAGKRLPKLRMTVERLLGIEPCFVDPTNELPQAFARAVKAVRGEKTGFSVNSGFTDMHFFAKDVGIPTIGYGPGGQGIHATDERASLGELVNCAKVYARFLADWTGT